MLAYFTKGLTGVKCALSLMELAQMFRFRLKKPIVPLVLSQIDAFDMLVPFQRYCFNTCTSRSQ